MMMYRVAKKVTLLAGGKEHRQDNVVDAGTVGEAKIKSWLAKGYIAPLGNPGSVDLDDEDEAEGGGGNSFDGVFLPQDAVARLPRPDLIEYAKRIGLEGFSLKIKEPDLRKLINGHVEKLPKEPDAGEPGGDPGGGSA